MIDKDTYESRSISVLSCSTSSGLAVAILIAEKQTIYIKIYYISRSFHLILLVHHFLQLFGRVSIEFVAEKVLLSS